MTTSVGPLSGSHPSDQARSGLGASRFDPGQRAKLAAYYRAQCCFQTAENLERGAPLTDDNLSALMELDHG